MQAPFKHLGLSAALCLLCAATPATHAAVYMKFEGIKGAALPSGGPEVWHWFVTPLDPAVGGGVSVAVGDVTGDGMDPATVALLLPAVQKVREAAAQWPGPIPLDLTQPLPAGQAALLLPAVQKVREAASALPDPDTASLLDFSTDVDPLSMALLLPAVQKIREAAMHEHSGGAPTSDQELFSFLLPATHHAGEASDRIQLSNHTLPSWLGLAGAGDSQTLFMTGWSLQNGQVTLRMEGLPLAAVPEPATWALWLGGLGLAALVRRRRGACTPTP